MKYDERVMAAIRAAATDRSLLADAMTETLYVSDLPVLSGQVTVSAPDAEPAVMIETTLAERLDDSDGGSDVRLSVEVGGVEFDAYAGRLVHAKAEGYLTQVSGATPAYEWQRTPVGVDQEWTNTPANVVIFSALPALSQMYRSVEIPAALAEPSVTAQGSERVSAYDYIADAIELAEGEAGDSGTGRHRRVYDTALSGVTAYDEAAPVGEVLWRVVEGEDTDYGSVTVEPVDGERYHAVAVVRQMESGETEELARVLVDNGEARVNPASVLVIEYSPEEEAEGAEARAGVVDSAFATAFREAMRRGKDARKLTVPLRYRPYWLDRGDTVSVETREFTGQTPESTGERGVIVRRYRGRIAGYTWGAGRAEAELTVEGFETSEVFTPTPVLSPESAVSTRSGATREALWGRTYLGDPFLDTRLPWVFQDGSFVGIDTQIARASGVEITQLTGGEYRLDEVGA